MTTGAFVAQDLGSTNGSWLNGHPRLNRCITMSFCGTVIAGSSFARDVDAHRGPREVTAVAQVRRESRVRWRGRRGNAG
jgi:hypothetical protein